MLLSFVLIGAALAHCSYALLHHSRRLQARGTSPEIIWNMLKPSESLDWHSCYPDQPTKFECARLLVPLNYSAPISSSNNGSIAIIRIPSLHTPTSQDYKGPILFNPGGPGDSGVDFMLTDGNLLRTIVGNSFDVVSFDPRGVSRSIPTASFFSNDIDRDIWSARASVFNFVNTSTNSLGEFVANSRVVGQLAAATNYDGYLNYINTDFTARDMLKMTKAYGSEKIQYWGISYGSILGAVFASLFPDNVGRLIIDGVVDAENYFANLWSENLFDSDKVLQTFFDSCFNAGPSGCSFYASSPEAISRNLEKLYDITKSRPFPVFRNTSSSYGLVDYNFLRITVFVSLYFPYSSFPPLAHALAELSKGNAEPLWEIGPNQGTPVADAMIAIGCNDGDRIPGTLEDAEVYFEELLKTSEWADVWARLRISCSGWPGLPKNFFRGPFVGNTSYPILLIGNTLDPVAPLVGAKKMSKGYPRSVVLTQDSAGHTSISGPSLCTMKYIRAYFENGTLPDHGTICPVLGPPIPQFNGTQVLRRRQELGSDEDTELIEAIVELSKRRHIN